MVRLDGQPLLLLLAIQKPRQAHHVALLLCVCRKLVVLVISDELGDVFCPVLVNLQRATLFQDQAHNITPCLKQALLLESLLMKVSCPWLQDL